MAQLPEGLRDFAAASGIDPEQYAMLGKLPRYVRARGPPQGRAECVRKAFGASAVPVPWVAQDALWELPRQAELRGAAAHADGSLQGIDLGSLFAVGALDPAPRDRVLDICCAPGAKLVAICDALRPPPEAAEGDSSGLRGVLQDCGVAVGVDCSLPRLHTARQALVKHGVARCCRLVAADGRTFAPLPPQGPGRSAARRWWDPDGRPLAATAPARQRKQLAACYPALPSDAGAAGVVLHELPVLRSAAAAESAAAARRGQRKRPRAESEEGAAAAAPDGSQPAAPEGAAGEPLWADPLGVRGGFDRVLVDAECATDGSLRHLEKELAAGDEGAADGPGERLRQAMPGTPGGAELFELQCALLRRGLALCRPGGAVVYSTCSLSPHQNEGVVEHCLRELRDGGGEAALVADPFAGLRGRLLDADRLGELPAERSTRLPGAVLFTPLRSRCGAQFIAKILVARHARQ